MSAENQIRGETPMEKHAFCSCRSLGILSSVILAAIWLAGCAPTTTFIDFEDLNLVTTSGVPPQPVVPGKEYKVGDAFKDSASGVTIMVLPFQWPKRTPPVPPPDDWTADGFVRVVQENKAGGLGNEIHFNNATLGIVAPGSGSIKGLTLKFGEYGGNVNLIVNGVLENREDFDNLNATTVAGVNISVVKSSPGDPRGTLKLSGTMSEFYFQFPKPPGFPTLKYSAVVGGGQELWIDDIELVQ